MVWMRTLFPLRTWNLFWFVLMLQLSTNHPILGLIYVQNIFCFGCCLSRPTRIMTWFLDTHGLRKLLNEWMPTLWLKMEQKRKRGERGKSSNCRWDKMETENRPRKNPILYSWKSISFRNVSNLLSNIRFFRCQQRFFFSYRSNDGSCSHPKRDGKCEMKKWNYVIITIVIKWIDEWKRCGVNAKKTEPAKNVLKTDSETKTKRNDTTEKKQFTFSLKWKWFGNRCLFSSAFKWKRVEFIENGIDEAQVADHEIEWVSNKLYVFLFVLSRCIFSMAAFIASQ